MGEGGRGGKAGTGPPTSSSCAKQTQVVVSGASPRVSAQSHTSLAACMRLLSNPSHAVVMVDAVLSTKCATETNRATTMTRGTAAGAAAVAD